MQQMPTDRDRVNEQARRQRIMDGTWKRDGFEYLRQQLGVKRSDDWGGMHAVDTATNLLRDDAEARATLYLRPSAWVCMVGDQLDPDAAAMMQTLTDRAEYPVQMTDVLQMTLGINDYAVRYDVSTDGDPSCVLYPTSPARILHAESRADNLRQCAVVHEEAELERDGQRIMGRRVWTDETVTLYNERGEQVGDPVPHMQGRCPWVLYHAHGRPQLWWWTWRSEQVEGTYALCLDYSYARHNRMEASWSQRFVVNARPYGLDTQASEDGTSTAAIVADPTTVLPLQQDDPELPAHVGQWTPPVDPDTFGRAVAREHGRLSLSAAGTDVAVYRKSGNAESAYAMAITREAQREQQVALAPRMAPSDAYLAQGLALAVNTQVPGVFPDGAEWRNRYTALPPSIEELDRIARQRELGLLSEEGALQAVDPFMTLAEARAVLAARTTPARTTPARPATQEADDGSE